MEKALKLIILLSISIPISLNGQSGILKMLWIQKDKRNFKNLAKFISKRDFTLENFKSEIKSLYISEENQIWKNSSRVKAYQYGGFISHSINIASYNDTIFSMEINIFGEDATVLKRIAKKNKKIELELKKNWKYSSIIDSNKKLVENYKYVFVDKKIKSQFEKNMADELGEMYDFEINEEIRESYEILIDPLRNYEFGYSCYYEMSKPDGRKAIEKILEAKRFDLLKNIIRGYNPEGRAYGIEALFKIYSENKSIISKEDKECIESILESNIFINECSGCDVSPISYEEIFPPIK